MFGILELRVIEVLKASSYSTEFIDEVITKIFVIYLVITLSEYINSWILSRFRWIAYLELYNFVSEQSNFKDFDHSIQFINLLSRAQINNFIFT